MYNLEFIILITSHMLILSVISNLCCCTIKKVLDFVFPSLVIFIIKYIECFDLITIRTVSTKSIHL